MSHKEPPSPERFPAVMQRTISLVGEKLPPEQIRQVAQVFHSLCWEFPDYGLRAYFLVWEDGRVGYAATLDGEADATIAMDARTFHQAAFGTASFAQAFLTGKLRVKGIPALKLTRFIPLLQPFLESYKQAWEELHDALS